jgi:hypothetical protein
VATGTDNEEGTMINTDDRPSAEVLMESLTIVDGAKRVVILVERDDAICVKTNCSYRDLKWVLDQAVFATMNELFGVKTESDG